MRIQYIDGSVEEFKGIGNTDEGDNFLSLQDEDNNTKSKGKDDSSFISKILSMDIAGAVLEFLPGEKPILQSLSRQPESGPPGEACLAG